MRVPFNNFFKKLTGKKEKPKAIKEQPKIVWSSPKVKHSAPYTFNDAQAKVRRLRNIKARIQKNSRRTNR